MASAFGRNGIQRPAGGEAFAPLKNRLFASLDAGALLHLLALTGAQLLRQVAQGQFPTLY